METRKIIGHVREISETVDETRTITFVASDESIDRHGTVIRADSWKLDSFNSNPIIGWQHNVYGESFLTDPDPDQIIGRGNAYIDGTRLLMDITFENGDNNPLAQKIFNKIKSGILNAGSVGFLETEEGRMGNIDVHEDPKVYYFGKVQLIEFSIVSIPSNENALVKEMEEFVLRKMEAQKAKEKPEPKQVKQIIKKIYNISKK